MTHVRKRSVLGTSTTTGTGALTLSTTAVAGFRSIQSVCAVNDTVKYRIWGVDANGNATGEWEDGIGTYSATDTLTRTSPLQGSAGALTAVTFSAGTKWVAITSFEQDTLSPAQITANQNDYNPTGAVDADIWRLTSDQARKITGIAGGYDGRRIEIQNVNTVGSDGDLIFTFEDTGSSAANRFAIDNDVILEPSMGMVLTYDGAATRWRSSAVRRKYTGSTFRLAPMYATDFLGGATADTGESSYAIWDLSLLSTGTQAKIAGVANHPGILQITSSTTANSGAFIRTSVDALLIGGGEIAEFVFRIPDLTTATIRMGFIDNATSADCVDGCYIEIPSTGAAVGKTSSNSTRTTSATIATLSTNTWYRGRVTVDRTAANVTFQIFDDSGNQLGTQTNSANIPTATGRETGHGIIGTKSGTVAQAIFQIDYMSIEWTKALI
jgi:hypothetical protein